MTNEQVNNFWQRREMDGKLFKVLFEECEAGYAHSEEQLQWGEKYMVMRMSEVTDLVTDYYDENLRMDEVVDIMKKEMEAVFNIRMCYFVAKERAAAKKEEPVSVVKKQEECFIDFMLEEVEDGMDGDVLWSKVQEKGFGHDDFVKLANVVMMTHQIPEKVRNRLWDNM